MNLYFGSARIDENGHITGGKAGDQKQTDAMDYKGEVSMQKFYVHKKGWNVLRAKNVAHANKIADAMMTACNNPNVGYNQNERLGIIDKGTNSRTPVNCDCSSLIRQCVKEATGKDAGNFTTANAKDMLYSTGLFEKPFAYTNSTTLYNGDILCTKTKGHIGCICYGNPHVGSAKEVYYPKYEGNSSSITEALKSIGEDDVTYQHRKRIAVINGISENYTGSAQQNIKLLALLKNGKLRKSVF